MNRRKFINAMGAGAIATSLHSIDACDNNVIEPFFIATWNNSKSVAIAVDHYKADKDLLDSLVKGINAVEDDPLDMSVGLGGRPDRDGLVTLDACIMDDRGNAGSVTFVQNYRNPISLAKDVMLKTPHVIMSGKGAEKFAVEQGYKKQDLLTSESKKQYLEWLEKSEYKPVINIENHDTIGMLAYNEKSIVGGCSTSGLAYKMHGRVGDSPIIGAGLFVDNEIGACVATGLGEKVLKTLCAFLVVELMRNGLSPKNACKAALERILKGNDNKPDFQVALIAINREGKHDGYSIYGGFKYAYASEKSKKLVMTDHFYEW